MKKSIFILVAAILSFTALSQTNINNSITGSGTANYIPRFTSAKKVANSVIFQSSGNIGVGLTNPSLSLEIKSRDNIDFNAIKLFSNNMLNNITLGYGGLNSSSYLKFRCAAFHDFQFQQLHDGIGSGVPNFSYINNTGGTFLDFQSTDGYLYKYNKNGTTHTTVSENQGFYKTSLANRFDVVNLSNLKTKLSVNMSNGFTAIGDDFFSPTSQLHINGTNGYNQLRLETKYTPTSTADANGNVGDTAWDETYWYIKTSAGWKRSALTTF